MVLIINKENNHTNNYFLSSIILTVAHVLLFVFCLESNFFYVNILVLQLLFRDFFLFSFLEAGFKFLIVRFLTFLLPQFQMELSVVR